MSAGSLLQPAKELGTDRSTALSSALKRNAENIDARSPGKSGGQRKKVATQEPTGPWVMKKKF